MKKNRKWLLTAKIDEIIPKRLGNLTLIDAQNDGFQDREECIWGLLEVNHLIRKRIKTQTERKENLDWCLGLFFVIYKWIPLEEEYNPKDNLKTFGFTHFIPKIKDWSKKQTIRIYLKKLVPGDKVWLMENIRSLENKKEVDLPDLRNFFRS